MPGAEPDDGSAPAVSIRSMVLDHDRKIDGLLAWRSEIRGALGLMKVAFGASILSAVVSILAVAQMMGGTR
jgi:hypothetical protein